MTTTVDTSEVRDFAHDLGRVPGRVVPAARQVVKKALQNVKDDARSRVSSHRSWKHIAGSINYDAYGLEGEVGYDNTGQGELAGIYEFGSARGRPHPTLIPAANAEADRFVDALDRAIRGLL